VHFKLYNDASSELNIAYNLQYYRPYAIFYRLSNIYWEIGAYNDAYRYINDSINECSGYSQSYFLRAVMYECKQQFDSAKQDIEHLCSINPTNSKYKLRKAKLELKLNNYTNCISDCFTALKNG